MKALVYSEVLIFETEQLFALDIGKDLIVVYQNDIGQSFIVRLRYLSCHSTITLCLCIYRSHAQKLS